MPNRNHRILIVDDNPDIHADFKKILLPKSEYSDPSVSGLEDQLFGDVKGVSQPKEPVLNWSYEVDSAFQGEAGVKMVENAIQNNVPYALVFMDVRMPPGWDGIETTRKIWERFPYTEIVLCTAYSDYKSDDITSVLGVSHRLLFLKKPFDSVAVKQMALALTAKWNFEAQARTYTDDLEKAVEMRTQKLIHMNSELDKSLKKLSDTQALLLHSSKMSALGEMAGGVAHEINNPLSIILMMSNQLQTLVEETPIDKAELINVSTIIEKTVVRIAKVVDGLKSFSREGEREAFHPVPIKRIVEDTLNLCYEKFKNSGVEIRVPKISDSVVVECRSIQIGQVLLNLFNNAYDAIIDYPEKWIEIDCKDQEHEVEIWVTDCGPGIPKEYQDKLFQPFFTTKEIGKGTGLGLSVSSGLVAVHNGVLALDAHCKNTRFIIRLPKKEKKR